MIELAKVLANQHQASSNQARHYDGYAITGPRWALKIMDRVATEGDTTGYVGGEVQESADVESHLLILILAIVIYRDEILNMGIYIM